MATITPSYGVATAMTITLASLASDPTAMRAGRESTAVDNKDVSDAIDVLLGGKITTGTSPSPDSWIDIYVGGSYDDTEFAGGLTGTNAALTVATDKQGLALLQRITVDGTSNKTYKWGPVSLQQVYGFLPVQWSVFVVHNTFANLNGTATNHEIVYVPVKLLST